MSRGFKIVIAGLWLSVLLLWVTLPRLARRSDSPLQPPAATAAQIAEHPTWTPTLPPVPPPPTATPPGVATSTFTPLPPPSPSPPATATPLPTATATPPPPTPPPPTAVAVVHDGRIDAIGPIPLPTVAPLSFGSGRAPVRLRIPALDLDTPVLPMGWHVVSDASGVRSEWDVVDFAAGHHINTAYPGEPGNVVLSGHNNIGGSVFRTLCVIGEPGVDFGLEDEMILVDESDRRFTYQVNGWQRLAERNASIATRLENAQWMAPTDHAQLTLVTCWPPWSNTHRVIVTGLLTAISP